MIYHVLEQDVVDAVIAAAQGRHTLEEPYQSL